MKKLNKTIKLFFVNLRKNLATSLIVSFLNNENYYSFSKKGLEILSNDNLMKKVYKKIDSFQKKKPHGVVIIKI